MEVLPIQLVLPQKFRPRFAREDLTSSAGLRESASGSGEGIARPDTLEMASARRRTLVRDWENIVDSDLAG